ncbi:UPF0614 [Hibiscus syriacus]|uniref:UPF0614 n=1 Tax=Hibiscus syriacus TaxID=106335 RepID=A0A6A2YQD5_HIBSY|nr:UPF0614 [Hibiscus syriacus]
MDGNGDAVDDQHQDPNPSLFPLFPAAAVPASTIATSSSVPQWLSNPSFTADLSLINDPVSSLSRSLNVEEEEEEEEDEGKQKQQEKSHRSYELLEEEEEEEQQEDSDGAKMDVPRYKLRNPEQLSGFMYHRTHRLSTYDKDADIDALDPKLKSAGRYWAPNNAALEHHKDLKRLRRYTPKNSSDVVPADFIPLTDIQSSPQRGEGSSISNNSVIEESWEDEVLRKTREFNKLTREHPHDEKAWLAFADFQDKVASLQRHKGVRLQTLEKKISILEKATELNPDNEQILLCLMRAYQKRDNTDVLIGRWKNVLMLHSGSYMLWREFLHVVEGEFSRFKVSDMRKMYAHAIQALSATCNKQFRQIHETSKPADSALVHQELDLVDIFISLCRLEWQTGHQELAIALFQAELGIDVDDGAGGEVKDTLTWARWSEEESSRDSNQWMPVRAKSGSVADIHGVPNEEADEQFLREILYEDVCEYLFSLSSNEAHLSLVFQFIDFFGGKISSWVCTNSSSWTEKILSLEGIPDCIWQNMRRLLDDLNKLQSKPGDFSLEFLLDSARGIPQRTEMMKFLRNAALLCLTAFPRNHILEEAALLAEELLVTRMNSSSCSGAPCQSLAKRLLKSDRQDLQSNSSLLYLWYAEAELRNNRGSKLDSSSRAMHILSCLGSSMAYSPFTSHPSSLQLLKARQGFKEKLDTLRSKWVRGFVDDQSVALVCAAVLFEELAAGWSAGIEIIDHVFTMVLPERRSQSHHLEYLFNYYFGVLQRHHEQFTLPKAWESVTHGLQIYPSSPELFKALVEISCLYTTPNKLRWMFDDHCHKRPSGVVWLFALIFEISRSGSPHRIHGLFERALANDKFHSSVVLWRLYVAYEINVVHNASSARRIFFRAIHACPWSKKLWLDGFLRLSSILTAKELSDLQEGGKSKSQLLLVPKVAEPLDRFSAMESRTTLAS